MESNMFFFPWLSSFTPLECVSADWPEGPEFEGATYQQTKSSRNLLQDVHNDFSVRQPCVACNIYRQRAIDTTELRYEEIEEKTVDHQHEDGKNHLSKT